MSFNHGKTSKAGDKPLADKAERTASGRPTSTGSCVVIGDVGAVHCRSVKQLIVSKSSTEAELIGLSLS
jgi:hypothetical protein